MSAVVYININFGEILLMNSYIQNIKHRWVCLALTVCMLFTFSSCLGAGSVYSIHGSPELIVAENPDSGYHTAKDMKSVLKSGLYELLLDEKNCSFALKDTSGMLWYALPTANNSVASLLSMEVTNGEKTYVLNSQDNSVAFGTAKTKVTDNGIEFSYVLSEKKDSPVFKIPVTLEVTLADGQLSAEVDCSEMSSGTKDYYISDIDMLPYFGAVSQADEGDFILIPDGSGALINLSKAGDSNYSVTTYGADYAVEESETHSAIIAAFGLKNDTSAFAGIVTDGDAISEINAKTLKDGLDNVYASFNITPNGLTKTGDDKYDFALAEQSYDGTISVCYRFISGSSATYSGLASMCREQLVRSGMLSTRSVSDDGDLPLNVTLIGGIKNTIMGTSAYTTFENAEDIAAVLKAKGINALTLKYDGALSGGLEQNSIGNSKLLSKLGNHDDYDSLQSYLSSQGFDLYLTVDLITTSSSGEKAAGVLHNSVNIDIENTLSEYFGSDTFDRFGLSSENLTENVVEFMNRMKDLNVPGYCIGDAGHILYSDFSNGYTDRQTYSESIFGQAIALSTNKNLMVEHGNLYTLKNALMISDVPLGVSYDETASYSSIPFVQMILHGTIEYTGEYFNLASDYDQVLLRALEYGALPSFKWSSNEYVPKDAEQSLIYYDNWTSKALDVYNTFNTVMYGLRSARMTDHTTIQDGVTCTEYNNETYLYVNYTDEDVTYNNLTIKAGSYLRVN